MSQVLFTYDKNGNLKDDGVLLYDYDALNRLTQVRRKSNNQIVGQYSYDAQNRRARKTISNGGLSGNIPSGTTDFIYRDWQVVEERTGSTVNKQYIWGNYIDECIQLRTYVTSGAGSLPAGTYYPLQDLLYRTKALTDTSGDIVEAYDYDPYGNTLIFSAAGAEDDWWADDATQANYGGCEVLYAGYRYDAESKTYQVRNRQYNPALGRWIQRDPIGFGGGDWNLYGYVGNNPINVLDFDGNESSGQCFWRFYDYYAKTRQIIPENACELAKRKCGSTINCPLPPPTSPHSPPSPPASTPERGSLPPWTVPIGYVLPDPAGIMTGLVDAGSALDSICIYMISWFNRQKAEHCTLNFEAPLCDPSAQWCEKLEERNEEWKVWCGRTNERN